MGEHVKIVPALCTQCGGRVEVDPNSEKAACPFCGMTFIVEKAINNYNVQHATIEHADNVNIDMTGTVKTVLDFVGDQIKEGREERKEQRKLEAEKDKIITRGMFKIFGIMFAAMFIFAIIAFIYFQITDKEITDKDSTGDTVYSNINGWSVAYDDSLFDVAENGDDVSFEYKNGNETATVNIRNEVNVQPEELLTNVTENWGHNDNINKNEGFFPGTTDKWGYWRTLTGDHTGEGCNRTAIAGEYNDGVLLFDVTEYTDDIKDGITIDDVSDLVNSITYESFEDQTIYDYYAGTYVAEYTDEIEGENITTTYSVTLNEDHTGTLSFQDDVDIIWGTSTIWYDDYSSSMEFTIEGDSLYINDANNEWISFEREGI